MSNIELKKANQMAAIDLLINNPELNKTELASELNMTPQTIHNWFADDRFVEMYYKKYMISFNAKLPMVLNSMVREAVEGNVQAGRLVLEHSGKLVKNINVTVDSPFEKFLKATEIDAAEIIDVEDEEVQQAIDILPKRNPVNDKPLKRTQQEKKAVEQIKKGKKPYRQKRREDRANRYALLQRAKKVGLDPLPAKRPTNNERRKWLEELIEREESMKSQTRQA
jgi:predicted transcriptional regulator